MPDQMEPLDIVDDRKVLGVMTRRVGGEDDPRAVVVVEVRLSDGSSVELGREPLGANFSTHWSLAEWTNGPGERRRLRAAFDAGWDAGWDAGFDAGAASGAWVEGEEIPEPLDKEEAWRQFLSVDGAE